MHKMRGFSLFDALLILAAFGLMIAGNFLWRSIFPDLPIFIVILVSVGSPIALIAICVMLATHEEPMRHIAIALFKPYAEREKAFQQAAKQATFLALPKDILPSSRHIQVNLLLKRRFFISLVPAPPGLKGTNFSYFEVNGNQYAGFTPKSLNQLEQVLQSELRRCMGPRLAPLAAYLWPGRVMTFNYRIHSAHDALQKISEAEGAVAKME